MEKGDYELKLYIIIYYVKFLRLLKLLGSMGRGFGRAGYPRPFARRLGPYGCVADPFFDINTASGLNPLAERISFLGTVLFCATTLRSLDKPEKVHPILPGAPFHSCWYFWAVLLFRQVSEFKRQTIISIQRLIIYIMLNFID